MKAILLDIEGTTTPIDFVHKTLFPYAKARIAGFVQTNLSDLKFEIEQLVAEHAKEAEYSGEMRPDSANSVSDYLKFLIDEDRKSTPLKSIEGMIWQSGFEAGEIVSPIFDDVPAAFERWKTNGQKIAIYSSGSILAQQMLFRYTEQGNLTPFISNYFDTGTGPKREPESYEMIASALDEEPSDVLFVSDLSAELDAAGTAGMETAKSIRPGNPPPSEGPSHPIVTSFEGLG